MGGVTEAMTRINAAMSMPKLQKIMGEFARENEKAEIVQEMMGDAIDDAFEEEGQEEEEEMVVNQILDEIGIDIGGEVPDVPTNIMNNQDEVKDNTGGEGKQVDELEERLNNLRRG